MKAVHVVKRSGERCKVDLSKIERVCMWAVMGLNLDYREVFSPETADEFLYDGIPTSLIQNILANKFASLSDKNYDASYAAARMLLQIIRKESNNGEVCYPPLSETLNKLQTKCVRGIDPRLFTDFNLEILDQAINPEYDMTYSHMAMSTLYDRYLLKDESGHVLESPQHFLMRVAMGLALNEREPTAQAIRFYKTMAKKDGLPSTPTLFNSGTDRPQLSSCFLSIVEKDALEGIFATGEENACYSKYSGGTAISLTPLRAKGSLIRSTGGSSSGVVPYAKFYEQVMRCFDQGGKRPGVTALYLETWHKDILQFLQSVDTSGDERVRLRDVNIATWNSDLFMRRVENDELWTLFSPHDVPDLIDAWGAEFEALYEAYEADPNIPKTQLPAKQIWRENLTTLFNRKGKGWICFKDECNRRSSTRKYGTVHSSNLCTEITLRTSSDRTAVCNLASVNLATLPKDNLVKELESRVRTLVRMIDQAVTNGFLPTEKAKAFNLEDRPLGLGIMGYTQWLILTMGCDFESNEHLVLADALMGLISYFATDESANLAREKGAFPKFEESTWAQGELIHDTAHPAVITLVEDAKILCEPSFFADPVISDFLKAFNELDWDTLRTKVKHGVRNSHLLAIAPTATIANIADATNCIELPYMNRYSKDNASGMFTIVSPLLQKLKGTDKEYMAKEAVSVDQTWVIKACAVRQRWIDQAQSANTWVKETIKGKDLSELYLLAWKLGQKTSYYLRSEAPDFEVKAGEETIEEPIAPVCNMDEGCEVCQ